MGLHDQESKACHQTWTPGQCQQGTRAPSAGGKLSPCRGRDCAASSHIQSCCRGLQPWGSWPGNHVLVSQVHTSATFIAVGDRTPELGCCCLPPRKSGGTVDISTVWNCDMLSGGCGPSRSLAFVPQSLGRCPQDWRQGREPPSTRLASPTTVFEKSSSLTLCPKNHVMVCFQGQVYLL